MGQKSIDQRYRMDCKEFTGYKPCSYHKKTKILCCECDDYRKIGKKILVIKTGAAGDVVRTTPILHAMRTEWPEAEIHWITKYPELLPDAHVDGIYGWNYDSLQYLRNMV